MVQLDELRLSADQLTLICIGCYIFGMATITLLTNKKK